MRVITGVTGTGEWAANVEVKCFDATANPYLLMGCVLAAGAAGIADELRLPEPVTGDPAALDDEARAAAGISRLPTSAGSAAAELADSAVLAAAMGPELRDAVLTVRQAEAQRCAELTPDELAEATRWRW